MTFVYPVPVPYSFPVLQRIADDPRIELTVLYARASLPGRAAVDSSSIPFEHRFLPNLGAVHVGANVREIDFNPTIPLTLERSRPDLVTVSGYVQPTMVMAIGWARLRRTAYAILSESHGAKPRTALRARVRSALVRRTVTSAAVLFPTGDEAASELRRLGADPTRIVVFPHVPDTDVFMPAGARELGRSLAGCSDDELLVVYVGRLVEVRGVSELMRAWTRIHDRVSARLLVVGDGPLAADLRAQNVEGVAFAGQRAPGEVAEILRGADLCVLPTRSETWGTAALEALAAGCPIVATDGVPSAVEALRSAAAGVIVPSGDERALGEAIARVLSDDGERQRMAEATRAAAAPYTPAAAAAAFADAAVRWGRPR